MTIDGLIEEFQRLLEEYVAERDSRDEALNQLGEHTRLNDEQTVKQMDAIIARANMAIAEGKILITGVK